VWDLEGVGLRMDKGMESHVLGVEKIKVVRAFNGYLIISTLSH
jgi:hypothetical protein